MGSYDTVMHWARRLQDIVTAHNFEVPEFEDAMGYFAAATGDYWPDVPFEVVQDALANFGPEGVRGAVAKYRLDQLPMA